MTSFTSIVCVIKDRLTLQSIELNYGGARGGFITYISNFYRNNIDNGWLAEREGPRKLKESLTSIFAIVNRVITIHGP